MQKSLFKSAFILLTTLLVLANQSLCTAQKIYLNENEFRDKVYACWLGKNIGGTLGMPFEGKTNINNLTYYSKLKEGEPAPNDDLDLQMLWLKAMQEHNAHVDAFTLGQYWLKYIPVNWNEYGIGKANMRAGLMPPVSGEFNNAKWKTSNGAWIRSEIWACLFPGHPEMAVKFAREDACVDHGMAEGTYAEIFTAALESAAFVEPDRDRLISFGLSMIPPDCRVAGAVRTAVKTKNEGKSWEDARTAVISNTEDMGWFQAPRNVAFTIIGWLYGDGDFGKSICIAVNCGDDTDCTGATLASILGIIGGTKAIPDIWRKPVGDKIATVAVKGFRTPATLDELTDSTVAMTKRVSAKYDLAVTVGSAKTKLQGQKKLLKPDMKDLEKLWHISPWRIARHNADWVILLDYLQEPVISENIERKFSVSVSNVSGKEETYDLKITGLPDMWKIAGLPEGEFTVEKGERKSFDFSIVAEKNIQDTSRLNLQLRRGPDSDNIPFTLFRKKS